MPVSILDVIPSIMVAVVSLNSVHVILLVHIFCICQLLVLWFDGQNNMASIVIVHTVPQGGYSPLYAASQEGHTDVVDILLRSGADVHQTIINVCHYTITDYLPSDSTHSLHVFVSIHKSSATNFTLNRSMKWSYPCS